MMLLDNIGFVANMASLVLYFFNVMHFDLSSSATTTTNYLGTAFLLTVVGGFISDISLGGGGIKGSAPALGVDQFDYKDPNERKHTASFFNWFLFIITRGGSIGVTFVVYVSTKVRWCIGFIISLSCAFIGLVFLALGKRFYHVRIPGNSPLLRILEVFVVALKNGRVELPQNSYELTRMNYMKYVFWANWYKYKKDVPVDEEKLLNSGPRRPNEPFSTSVNGLSRQQEELLKSSPGFPHRINLYNCE
ncbi:hypothetical protein SLEP1_g21830 [Rubroshorea leprosula]|uniref:Uncharacterized protein n=1 Tax=Rubroshorea leprosula TaxID=152421 RepID=A0AAV5JCP5_9ROSI|nr:hypothetical protein SLEP1_g21830 [Rubroshorea leprosula]